MVSRRFYIFTTVFFFILSLVLGGLLWQKLVFTNERNKHPLLAKRLFLENPSDILINFDPLRDQIDEYLKQSKLDYHSFYFEYLFTGSTIRDGDDNQLVGASLMKIPLIMDLYKAAEQGKINLDNAVVVPDNAVSGDAIFGNPGNLKPGDQISLREAAKLTLLESDNTAAFVVYQNTKDLLPEEEQAIHSLDVQTETKQNEQGTYVMVGARAYASFLKCLYFSCFLSTNNSQEILQHMSAEDTPNRIRGGTPTSVEVAHKIGSFSSTTQSDCGIVYVPNRAYLLCVMLKTDNEAANKHIQAISKIVYDYVSGVN